MSQFVRVALLAFASAGLVGTTPAISVRTFTVPLSGQAQSNFASPSGGTGDLSASGRVTLSVDPVRKRVCYDFRLSGLSDPMMAHIHKGAPLQNGPPVIILFVGTGKALEDCAPSTRSQLSDIAARPSEYYVSIDTTEFPDGALRGQLPSG